MMMDLINNTGDELMRLALDRAQLQTQLQWATLWIVVSLLTAYLLLIFGLRLGAYLERKNWRESIERAMDSDLLSITRKHSWVRRDVHDRHKLLRELVESKIKEREVKKHE